MTIFFNYWIKLKFLILSFKTKIFDVDENVKIVLWYVSSYIIKKIRKYWLEENVF